MYGYQLVFRSLGSKIAYVFVWVCMSVCKRMSMDALNKVSFSKVGFLNNLLKNSTVFLAGWTSGALEAPPTPSLVSFSLGKGVA